MGFNYRLFGDANHGSSLFLACRPEDKDTRGREGTTAVRVVDQNPTSAAPGRYSNPFYACRRQIDGGELAAATQTGTCYSLHTITVCWSNGRAPCSPLISHHSGWPASCPGSGASLRPLSPPPDRVGTKLQRDGFVSGD